MNGNEILPPLQSVSTADQFGGFMARLVLDIPNDSAMVTAFICNAISWYAQATFDKKLVHMQLPCPLSQWEEIAKQLFSEIQKHAA